MNQILDYNPNKSSGSGNSSGSDKIVRIFAVILVVFALCLVGSGVYGMLKNNKDDDVSQADTPTKAVITVERDKNDDTKAIIKVSHDKAIEKVIYTWDSGKDTITKGNGQPSMDVEISLLAGTHTLTVKVTDIDGNDTIYDEEIYSENGEDKVGPEIKTTVDQATKQIVIIATDDTELDYVTYRWNDEEEQKQEADPENPKEIKLSIEIPKGTNDLTIIAVDKNKNSTNKTDKYTGVTKPEIKITVSEDKKKITIFCSHENGITEASLTVNGQTMPVDLAGEIRKEMEFDYELSGTTNNIEVRAKSVDGTETIATEEITSEEPEEDEIEISLEKYEDIADKVKLVVKTSSEILEGIVYINGEEFYMNGSEGLKETPPLDIDLGEGTTKIRVIVRTVNGTERELEKEFTQG